MQFRCGYTSAIRSMAEEHWHRTFAILPVRVGVHECRWLEFVECRIESGGWGTYTTHYRPLRATHWRIKDICRVLDGAGFATWNTDEQRGRVVAAARAGMGPMASASKANDKKADRVA